MILRYLHLSDFHFTGDKNKKPAEVFQQDSVMRSMVRFVEALAKGKELNVDFVVATGDIANKAKPEDYRVAEEMCERVLTAAGLEKDRLFVVPGNHDVDRGAIKFWQKHLYDFKTEDDIVKILTDPECTGFLRAKFQAFDSFAKSAMEPYPADPSSFCYAIPLTLKKEGETATINMLGLNSAIFCGFKENGEEKGAGTKMVLERLALGRVQVETALERRAGDARLTVSFFHHPLGGSFHPEDGVCRSLLSRNSDLILTGHLHKDRPVQMKSEDGHCVRIGAGAAYLGGGKTKTFNITQIDLETGLGRTFFYRYEDDQGIWILDRNFNPDEPDGAFPFIVDSLCKPDLTGITDNESKSSGLAGKIGKTVDEKPSAPDLEAQIRKYLKNAAAYHEALPLAGFKTRLLVPIRIEDIYVPLRAMVHLSAFGDECFGGSEEAETRMDRAACEDVPLNEAFAWAERLGRKGLVILGDPGSGKTTHLKRLLLYCARQGPEKLGLAHDMVPVFLPLRDLKSVKAGLDSFIQEQLSGPHLDTPADFGKRLLERGRLLLLFDGLDEVSDPRHRQKVSRWVENALRYHHASCRFVVTSRFAGYRDEARLNEHFLEMHVRPLSEEHAEQFIRNWYSIVESGVMADKRQAKIAAGQKADALIERLKASEFRARRVFEMTRNPLLLANLCIVHRARGDLPRTRAKLYEECVDVLLERWRQGGGVPTTITADQGRRVLQPAARWMHQQENRARAKGEELVSVIEPALRKIDWRHGNARQFLETVRDESGILVGWGDGTYGFMHLGFQEYLAAREIRNLAFHNKLVLRQLSKRFGEAWYQEVILLLLALEEPSLFVPFMREVVKRDAFFRHSEMVNLCLDEAAEKSFEPFAELVEKGAGVGNDEDLWRRQLAALKVLERWEPSAVGPLMDIIRNHPFAEIRRRAKDADAEAHRKTIRPGPSEYELVRIPAGEFLMGSPETEEGRLEFEGPQHKVAVDEFYMGRYPVTNEEYGRFLEQNPEVAKPEYWSDRKFNQPNQPVVGVSWHDAEKYAKWAGLELPTEPQWEYACRAGTQTRFYTGDTDKDLDRAGWYGKNSDGTLHPVGEKEPNAWGLYDMHGNVFEWTRSLYGKYPYDPSDGREDMSSGALRVVRGGSWVIDAGHCRSAYRSSYDPGNRYRYHGFRLACLPLAKKEESKK